MAIKKKNLPPANVTGDASTGESAVCGPSGTPSNTDSSAKKAMSARLEEDLMEAPEEDLAWEVDDELGTTSFSEQHQCLQTILPDGLLIGWDICGCGRPAMSCGCVPIKLAVHVRKMRDKELKALQGREVY